MTEWHLSPDYIVNNWTDELLDLMVEKLVGRKQRETSTIGESRHPKDHFVSVETLAAMSNNMIRVEKN